MPRGVYDRKPREQEAARGANPGAAPGRADATARRCAHCLYFDPDVQGQGDCNRYPQVVRKRVEQGCGEFEAKQA